MTISLSADTNLFLYAANPDSPHHDKSVEFFSEFIATYDFIVCELVLVELYMLLRNPSVLARPLSSKKATEFCNQLRGNAAWQHVDYEPAVSQSLWQWAHTTKTGFRRIIDARLALTLRHHGVSAFATANVKDFGDFGFDTLWNPIKK